MDDNTASTPLGSPQGRPALSSLLWGVTCLNACSSGGASARLSTSTWVISWHSAVSSRWSGRTSMSCRCPSSRESRGGVSQLPGLEVPTCSTSPCPPPELAPAWGTHRQPSAGAALPVPSMAGAKGSSRSGCSPLGRKYLLTPQVSHFPQELEQLSLIRAQPCPVGARRGHEEDHQVVGRRCHGATGPVERIKKGRGERKKRERKGRGRGKRRGQKLSLPEVLPSETQAAERPPAASLPEDLARGRRTAAPVPTPPFPGAGGGRSHAGCTPGRRAMAAGFSARGRGPTCPPPPHVVQVAHTWRRPPIGPAERRRGKRGGAGGGWRSGGP